MRSFWPTVCVVFLTASHALFGQINGTNPLVRFNTDLGVIDVVLLQNVAPLNVANFLTYVNSGAYDASFIHRSVPNFVIQGGGFKFVSGKNVPIPANAPVMNEFHVSNTRGTLAMAKVAGDPNSATNQWFFNESDANAGPPASLDTQNGGFTVFGKIINSTGLTTMDTIAAVHINHDFSSPFDSIPLLNYTDGSGAAIHNANLVNVIWIKVVPQIVAVTHPNATTVHIQGRGAANKMYNLQTSLSPAGSGFTTLTSVTADASGNISFNDASAGATKFYRLALP